MPQLDVTDAILDVDFLDEFTYSRNLQSTDSNGINSVSSTTQLAYGVITSVDGDVIIRGDGSEYVKGSILIHTLVRLRNDTQTHDADIVSWDGADYTVKSVNSYSRYGTGFVCCLCEIINLSGGENE